MGMIVLVTSLNFSLQILHTTLFMLANIIKIPMTVPRTEKVTNLTFFLNSDNHKGFLLRTEGKVIDNK